LVVARVRERLTVNKQAAQKIDMERFYLIKLNKGDVKQQYQVTIRNKLADLENLQDKGTSTVHGTLLERISKFWPKRV
jgi:uncharacterized protein (DUF927 family)